MTIKCHAFVNLYNCPPFHEFKSRYLEKMILSNPCNIHPIFSMTIMCGCFSFSGTECTKCIFAQFQILSILVSQLGLKTNLLGSLPDLHHPPLILKMRLKDFTVQKKIACNFQIFLKQVLFCFALFFQVKNIF